MALIAFSRALKSERADHAVRWLMHARDRSGVWWRTKRLRFVFFIRWVGVNQISVVPLWDWQGKLTRRTPDKQFPQGEIRGVWCQIDVLKFVIQIGLTTDPDYQDRLFRTVVSVALWYWWLWPLCGRVWAWIIRLGS